MIAWAPEDEPANAQIEAVLDAFEETAWAGLESDRRARAAVLRREYGGGAPVHLLAAQCDLEAGRGLNIVPPGARRTFDPLRDALQPRARLAPARTPRLHRGGAAESGSNPRPAT